MGNTTARPWIRSPKASDAIISEVNGRNADDQFEYYGGWVVAESIRPNDLELILRAITLYDRITAGHAAACRIHDGNSPCDRMPGCLQDGR